MPYNAKRYGKKRPVYIRKTTYRKKTHKKAKRRTVNNLNAVSINPVTYPRILYSKHRWVGIENQQTCTAGSSLRRVYLGNSASPFPTQGALGAFGAIPNNIPAGEVYPGGFIEWSQLYDKYFVTGSHITMNALCSVTTSLIYIRAVMIPIMPSPDTGTDTLTNMINQLDAYTYDQLMVYPQAQSRDLLNVQSGLGKITFKSYRKTKDMLTIKDLADNPQINADTPNSAGANGQRPQDNLDGTSNLWGFYVRFFNRGAADVQIDLTTRMKLYFRYSQRRFVQAITST